jgi:hypothetical protein
LRCKTIACLIRFLSKEFSLHTSDDHSGTSTRTAPLTWQPSQAFCRPWDASASSLPWDTCGTSLPWDACGASLPWDTCAIVKGGTHPTRVYLGTPALSELGKTKRASSTLRASQAVPHPSTDRALQRLTSEFGRDPVYSLRYGR